MRLAQLEMSCVYTALQEDLRSFATIYWCNQVLIWTRAVWLLLDPYLARQLLPNFASALLYGIYFPVLNLQSLSLLNLMGLRRIVYDFCWYTTAGQFVTQVWRWCAGDHAGIIQPSRRDGCFRSEDQS